MGGIRAAVAGSDVVAAAAEMKCLTTSAEASSHKEDAARSAHLPTKQILAAVPGEANVTVQRAWQADRHWLPHEMH